MNKRIVVVLAAFLSFFSLTFQVHAGGGPVSLKAFALIPFTDTQSFIGQADVYDLGNCDDIHPKFSFKDSVKGDEISVFTPPDDGTYIERHFYTGYPDYKWARICTFYSNLKSGEKRQRTLVVDATVNGNTVRREIPVSFGDDPISQQIQSFDRYNNAPQVDVVGERYLGGPKRELSLQWNKVENASKYAIFVKEAGYNESLPPIITTTNDTKTIINLAAFLPFYIGVNACSQDEPCQTQKPNTWVVYVDKMHINENTLPQVTPIATTPIQPTISVVAPSIIPGEPIIKGTSGRQAQIDDLNKKVAELEQKLSQSQKKQSVLEQRITDIMNFLHRVFPFFKR